MKIELRYFAAIREALGTGAQTYETQARTLGELRDELLALSPEHAQCLARGRAVRLALNQVMSDEQAALSPGCEVAFFPPVTGG